MIPANVAEFSRHALVLLVAGLMSISLGGCHSDKNESSDLCKPLDGLTPICGFQSPEDLAVLPDKSGLLVSEFGQMGDNDGRLSMLSVSDNERTVLYDVNMPSHSSTPVAGWGDSSCRAPKRFSPHGLDLAQRPDNLWQLLVVNHAERERIEFFELLGNSDAGWSLSWRGCVQSNDDSLYNDVATVSDGFIVSRMMSKNNTGLATMNYFLGRDTGHVLHWNLVNGFTPVAGTQGVMPNGVAATVNGSHVFVNLYGEDAVRVVDTKSQAVLADLNISSADNINWDVSQKNKLLIASHDFNFFSMLNCMSARNDNCRSAFEIIELDASDYSQRSLVVNDGNFFGAATSAVRLHDKLYIGSFSGNRIVIAPVGHGVAL